MENGDLLKYEYPKNKFELLRNEEKSMTLQEILSNLVDSESSEKESEKIDFIRNIFQMGENNQKFSTLPKLKERKNYSESNIIRELYEKISKNFEKEKEEKNNKLEIDNQISLLKINYSTIIYINSMLVSIIKIIDVKQKEFGQTIKNLQDRNNSVLNMLKHSQIEFLQDLETIKTIEIKISYKKFDRIVNLDYILFFCIFFNFLFPYLLNLNLCLNCEKIDMQYYNERNPYRMKDTLAKKVAKKYEKILIANLLFCKLITRQDSLFNLKLTLTESYIIELNELTGYNIIFKNTNEQGHHSNEVKKFTFLDSFLNLNNLYCLNCEFNSLDSVSFEKINLILIKNISIASLSLNLFPKNSKFNVRKFYLNKKFFYSHSEEDPSRCQYSDDGMMCDLISLSNMNMDQYSSQSMIYTESKILKILFENFNQNLKNLIVILESKIKKLKYLKISINPYPFLRNYDFYNCAISCFVFNIYKILSSFTQKNLIDLVEFELDSFNLNFDFSKFQLYTKYLNLNKMKVNDFSLYNSNICNILRFDQIPNQHLNNLELVKISTENFVKFQNFLKEQLEKNGGIFFNNLNTLKISVLLDYLYLEDNKSTFFQSVCDLFKYKLPLNLEEINLKIENEIDSIYLMKIIQNIKKHSHFSIKKIKLVLNIDLREIDNRISPELSESCYIEDLKIALDSSKSIIVDIYKINKNSIDNLYRMLFCMKKSKQNFNKIYNEEICMQLTKFLFSKKNKSIEIFISNKQQNVNEL